MQRIITPFLSDNWAGAKLAGAKNRLEAYLKIDPQLAAFNSYNTTAIATLKAIAGTKGLRINYQEIQLALDNDMLSMRDTKASAQVKVDNITRMLNNVEDEILPGATATMPTGEPRYVRSKTDPNSWMRKMPGGQWERWSPGQQ
jgi:hypothetical protein